MPQNREPGREQSRHRAGRTTRYRIGALIACAAWVLAAATMVHAQGQTGQAGWSTGTAAAPAQSQVTALTLSAYLTAEVGATASRPISRGLVWRVFTIGDGNTPAKLIQTRREPIPTVRLNPGRYVINAAFGRAHLTQVVDVANRARQNVSFVLNAGGLRVVTKVVGGGIAKDTARYDIFSDERDQSGKRLRVISNARPGLITRLNSGIYHIVSRLGDANALVSAEVAVEAGKLTEAVVSHEAAKVTFKLVKTEAGEAHADTQWIIMTKAGDIIKESAGALPTHVLAPGTYNVSARRAGQDYSRSFAVRSGENVEVEVLMR